MPQTQYRVRGPDGVEHVIEGPDNATDEQIVAQAKRLFEQPATAPQAAAPPQSYRDKLMAIPGNLARGVMKGAYSTGLGLSKLAGAVPQSTTLDDLAVPFTGGQQAIGAPANAAEKIGFNTEQIGEFFVPAGMVGKAGKAVEGMTAASKLPGAVKTGLNVLGRSAAEAGSAGMVAASQSGSLEQGGKSALIAGGVNAAAPLVLGAAKYGGMKIEKWLMNPTKRDLENGFKIENVFRYDVGGTLNQTWQKTEKKINDLTAMLQASLKGTPGDVKIANAVQKTRADFLNNADADEAIKRIVKRMEFDLNSKGVPLNKGVLNAAEANLAKQSVGDMGAWLHNPSGKVVSDADAVTEKVANKLYGHLKREIEAKASGPVKEINKALSDLMAIRQAALRRAPVTDRQTIMSLGMLTSLASGKPHIAVLSALSKSGMAANALVKAGSTQLPARVAGQAAAAANRPKE